MTFKVASMYDTVLKVIGHFVEFETHDMISLI